MTNQTEPGYVCEGMDTGQLRELSTNGIELSRRFNHLAVALRIEFILVHSRTEDANAKSFPEDKLAYPRESSWRWHPRCGYEQG